MKHQLNYAPVVNRLARQQLHRTFARFASYSLCIWKLSLIIRQVTISDLYSEFDIGMPLESSSVKTLIGPVPKNLLNLTSVCHFNVPCIFEYSSTLCKGWPQLGD